MLVLYLAKYINQEIRIPINATIHPCLTDDLYYTFEDNENRLFYEIGSKRIVQDIWEPR